MEKFADLLGQADGSAGRLVCLLGFQSGGQPKQRWNFRSNARYAAGTQIADRMAVAAADYLSHRNRPIRSVLAEADWPADADVDHFSLLRRIVFAADLFHRL